MTHPMAHHIDLSSEHTPRFPDCCAVCRKDSPGTHVTVRKVWPLAPRTTLARFGDVKIPVCERHAGRLRASAMIGPLAIVVLILVAVYEVRWLILAYPEAVGGWSRWALSILAFVVPVVLVKLLYRPILDLSAYEGGLEVSIRNREYAARFRAENEEALETVNEVPVRAA